VKDAKKCRLEPFAEHSRYVVLSCSGHKIYIVCSHLRWLVSQCWFSTECVGYYR